MLCWFQELSRDAASNLLLKIAWLLLKLGAYGALIFMWVIHGDWMVGELFNWNLDAVLTSPTGKNYSRVHVVKIIDNTQT